MRDPLIDPVGDPAAEEYLPSPTPWVREQVEAIAAAGDTRAATIQGRPVVLLTIRGARSGKLRRVPLMRVEHAGRYAAVASKGGAPEHPQWYHNLRAHPEIVLQDGTRSWPATARELEGAEREEWWAPHPRVPPRARAAAVSIPDG